MSEDIIISGGKTCDGGSIKIAGAKNAALPAMAACLLTDQPVTLKNIPQIHDVREMSKQLRQYGAGVSELVSNSVTIQATGSQIKSTPNNNDGSKSRGSFLVLGPLLARFKNKTVQVYKPRGCKIDKNGRPVNFHTDALQQMGAEVEPSFSDYVKLKAKDGLQGAEIELPQISVGATEAIVMAACLANGQTTITNAAVEPEVMDLVGMLNKMGANISVNEGGNTIVIKGCGVGNLLNGCTHTIISDRIEAGTWAICVAMSGGSLLLQMDTNVAGQRMMATVLQKLSQAGLQMEWQQNGLRVQKQRFAPIHPVDITTGPFPEFPTDLLPQWVTLMTQATGRSLIEDTIYNDRFKHVQYLKKMGASFTKFSDSQYQVHGNAKLSFAHVVAEDLRGGAALILAALVADGKSVVKEFQHVLRGYENIKEKLGRWGQIFTKPMPQTRKGFHGGRR